MPEIPRFPSLKWEGRKWHLDLQDVTRTSFALAKFSITICHMFSEVLFFICCSLSSFLLATFISKLAIFISLPMNGRKYKIRPFTILIVKWNMERVQRN
jgi:hypothetical protein